MNGLLVVYLQDNEGGGLRRPLCRQHRSPIPEDPRNMAAENLPAIFLRISSSKEKKTPFEDPETHPPYDESRNKSKFMFRDTRNLPNPSRLVYYTLHR